MLPREKKPIIISTQLYEKAYTHARTYACTCVPVLQATAISGGNHDAVYNNRTELDDLCRHIANTLAGYIRAPTTSAN